MADDPSLFRARAAAENAIADGAQLDNVRDRALRSARAWTEMADRADRTRAQREEREQRAAPSVDAGDAN